MFKTKVDIIHNLCKDDIMVEMCVTRLLPCDKGEERVDREQERLLEELYKEMYSVLLCYANAALKDKALAEEAVQDTFRIACAKVGELSASENPRGWLMLTLKNVLRNTNRELAALNQLFVSAVSIDDEIVLETYASGTDYEKRIEDDEVSILYSDLLSPDEYRLLKRIVLQKYTIRDAAKELGISIESCKKRIQRIKKKLRKKLEEKPDAKDARTTTERGR